MKSSNTHFSLAFIVLLLSTLACNFGKSAAPTEIPGDVSDINPSIADTPQEGENQTTNFCANPYLPVVVGATWNYDLKGPIPDTYTHTILSVEADKFVEQDVFNSGVTRQAEWKCENGNLIALNPSGGNTSNVTTEGLESNFETTELTGVTLPAVINPGDTWSQSLTLVGTQSLNGIEVPTSNQLTSDCTAVGLETVTVTAGTFDAMRVDCHTIMHLTVTMSGNPFETTLDLNGTNLYAIKVGIVKSSTIGSGLDSTVELLSYNIP